MARSIATAVVRSTRLLTRGITSRSQGYPLTFLAERSFLDSQIWASASGSRMQIRGIRREPISQAQRQAEMEEEARRVDLDPAKCLKKGDPGTVQGIIKDVIPVGYWVTLPNGKDGYLPATDLGITGGVVLLERLMKVGQEITVRVDSIGGGGREILSMKRPECVPVINDRFGFANLSRNSTRKV
ncbi:hypothetical protein KP509_01G043200 [Ceratopteris richardii]|uniref:S1 motif domain-containing protein n=1 Tax=Ceratopteris richardii TaxID=49495 RepID=A0A8T2VCG7_CERRI|nr:hypothetical protein KP509_01G043200 [Ceratopteris richardii]